MCGLIRQQFNSICCVTNGGEPPAIHVLVVQSGKTVRKSLEQSRQTVCRFDAIILIWFLPVMYVCPLFTVMLFMGYIRMDSQTKQTHIQTASKRTRMNGITRGLIKRRGKLMDAIRFSHCGEMGVCREGERIQWSLLNMVIYHSQTLLCVNG